MKAARSPVRTAAPRALVSAVAVLALGAVAAGCRQTAALDRQEVVVAFTDGATQADHLRVWNTCHAMPGISPEPLATQSKYQATLRNNVRYRVDSASDYELQQLYDCLRKDPSVTGYRLVTPGGQ